jgi:tetratricopeptide (TPR) repeat protein
MLVGMTACSPDAAHMYDEHFSRGMNFYRQKDMSSAVGEFEQCLHQKETGEAYFMLAKIFFYQNSTDDFLRALSACLDIEPDYADALKLSARMYMREKNFLQAKEILEKVIHLDSADVEAQFMLGETSEALRDYRGALCAYERAEAAYFYLERVHTHQAEIYKALGADDRARVSAERAKKISLRIN